MKIKEMIYQKDRKYELLYTDEYNNYKYYILSMGTHPTAYIAIPKEHKLYEKSYDDIYEIIDIDVHGGLTYSDHDLMFINSEDWFIGWDYAHAGDYYGNNITNFDCYKKWTTKEIIEECESAIDQIIEEDKKIEKLYGLLNAKSGEKTLPNIEELMYKINELIDEVNKLKEEK